jgi:SAM-dependent methyltransferase
MIFAPIRPRISQPGLSYNDIADVYDRARPSYPDTLIDDILNFAGAPPPARVLEIGCGTGQATTSFASRGLRMVCLEPSPAMVRIARERLRSFDRVEVICQTFEAWPAERHAFDLVFSATAFHWVSRRVRFVKAAHALRTGGTLAVFNAVASPQAASLPDAVKNLMNRNPALSNAVQQWPFERQFRENQAFGTVDKRVYLIKRTYDAQGLEDLLRSLNRFRDMPDHEQTNLLKIARAAVESQGGVMPLDFRIRLIMARRESIRTRRHRLSHWLLNRSE